MFFLVGENPIFLSPSILAFQISLFLSNRFFSLFLNISSQYYLLRQLESSEGPYLFFFPLQLIISFQTFGLALVVKGEKYMFLYFFTRKDIYDFTLQSAIIYGPWRKPFHPKPRITKAISVITNYGYRFRLRIIW